MRTTLLLTMGLGLVACAQGDAQRIQTSGGGGGGGGGGGMQPDAPAAPIDAPMQHPDSPPPVGSCQHPTTGVLATWSFTSATGSQTSTTAASAATGVTASSFTRSASLTAVSGAGSINSSNWATSASRDSSRYYTLTITPPSGCTMSLTSAAIDAKTSTSGPASASIASDADSFAQTSTVAPNSTSSPSLSVTGATGAVEIRIYGYAATSTSGTMRVQNTFTVSGSLQ
ncbi:MAG: hypothetical protein ACM31C_21490 [Acidobacteriota bacterium]